MTPYYEHAGITIYHGDCREILPSVQAHAVVTDPPYAVKFASVLIQPKPKSTKPDFRPPEQQPKPEAV